MQFEIIREYCLARGYFCHPRYSVVLWNSCTKVSRTDTWLCIALLYNNAIKLQKTTESWWRGHTQYRTLQALLHRTLFICVVVHLICSLPECSVWRQTRCVHLRSISRKRLPSPWGAGPVRHPLSAAEPLLPAECWQKRPCFPGMYCVFLITGVAEMACPTCSSSAFCILNQIAAFIFCFILHFGLSNASSLPSLKWFLPIKYL